MNLAIVDRLRKHPGYQNLVKALTSVTDGAALIPQVLSRAIVDTLPFYQPEWRFYTTENFKGKKYEYDRRTSRGEMPVPMGESGDTPITNAAWERDSVSVAETRQKRQVTFQMQDASQAYVDAMQKDIESGAEAMALALNFGVEYGNPVANTYAAGGRDYYLNGDDGANRLIDTTAGGGFDASNGQGTLLTDLKATFDVMIDEATENGAAEHPLVLRMSPRMISRASGLLTQIWKAQGRDEIWVEGSERIATYRGIPLIPTTVHTGGKKTPVMADLTSAVTGGTTGGSFSDGYYNFKCECVGPGWGRSVATAYAQVHLTGGTATQKITLNIASLVTYKGAHSEYVRVYYASGQTPNPQDFKLLDEVAARTYDSKGTPTGFITTIPVLSAVATAAVNGRTNDRPYIRTNGYAPEKIVLMDFHETQGMGKICYNNQGGSDQGLVQVLEMARQDAWDTILLRASCALVPSWGGTSIISDGWLAHN